MNITSDDAEKFEVYVCPRCSTEKKQEFLNKPIAGETRKRLLHLIDQLLVSDAVLLVANIIGMLAVDSQDVLAIPKTGRCERRTQLLQDYQRSHG